MINLGAYVEKRPFSSESRSCLQHQEGRIHVLRHRGERTLSSSSYWPIIWRDAIGYTSRSPLVCIDVTLNIARYISEMLRPVALPFIRVLRNPTFQ
ncbi:hypothetical protein TNCV_3653821 [Trichonephila clavipes]|nr:hypothetical protein TNCV_3653821 [Trichonephila clavipes]